MLISSPASARGACADCTQSANARSKATCRHASAVKVLLDIVHTTCEFTITLHQIRCLSQPLIRSPQTTSGSPAVVQERPTRVREGHQAKP